MKYYFKTGFETREQEPETWLEVDIIMEHVYWYLRNFSNADYSAGWIVTEARERIAEDYRKHGIKSNPYESLKK